MKHPNAMVNAFLHMPEWRWKNDLRYFLAFSPLVPSFISDCSPVKGYELKRKLQPGDVVVDAGAYPGDYAIFAARKVGPSGRVICFEPGENNRAVLEKNVRGEGLSNVTIVPKGLWKEDAVLQFRQDGLASTALDPSAGGDSIAVTTLDAELARLAVKSIQVLKMDIEGAEIEAIQGAKETLLRSRAYVCIASYHVVNGENTSRFLEEFLRGIGYHAETGYPKHLTTYGWRTEASRAS
jgi:FkbM family methyltransferase